VIITVVFPFCIATVAAIGVVGAAAVTTATEEAVIVVASIVWLKVICGLTVIAVPVTAPLMTLGTAAVTVGAVPAVVVKLVVALEP
jgi:hypothetical protein